MIQAIVSTISTLGIAPMLAQFDFGDGVMRPAVFSVDPAPRECGLPLVVIVQDGGQEGHARGQLGGRLFFNIRVFGSKQGSELSIRAIAWGIWNGLMHQPLSAEGYSLARAANATLPERFTDSEGFPGYNFNLSVQFFI